MKYRHCLCRLRGELCIVRYHLEPGTIRYHGEVITNMMFEDEILELWERIKG
jgi:hypothetical protein